MDHEMEAFTDGEENNDEVTDGEENNDKVSSISILGFNSIMLMMIIAYIM